MDKLVARTYADALFEVALEEKKIEIFTQEVDCIQQLLAKHTDLYKLMNHPGITKNEKADILDEIFKGRVSNELTGWIQIIAEKGRYGELTHILDYFMNRVREYQGIGLAYVTSAMELKESQKEQLLEKLLHITKYHQITMEYTIDESLIGGLTVQIGDRVIDNSIKTKIYNMSKQLSTIPL